MALINPCCWCCLAFIYVYESWYLKEYKLGCSDFMFLPYFNTIIWWAILNLIKQAYAQHSYKYDMLGSVICNFSNAWHFVYIRLGCNI